MYTHKDFLKRIGVILTVLLVMMSFAACGSGSNDDDRDVYVPPVNYVSPYVRMVTEATNSTYGITYGDAFEAFFGDPEWEYFLSTDGQHVVEFNGEFSYSGYPATATIQFVIDMDEGTFTAYHLSIDGEAQSRLMLASMIQKVFESY